MRLVAPVVVAALSGMLWAGSFPAHAAVEGSEQEMAQRPDRVGAAVARLASRGVAEEFARSNPPLLIRYVGGCKRRSERRVDCSALLLGFSDGVRKTCRLRTAVRATTGAPRARLRTSNCWTRYFPELTEAGALVAFNEQMAKIAGQPVQITRTERASRTSFRTLAEWTRPGGTSGTEKCTAGLTATLRDPSLVELAVLFVDCKQS